MECLVLNPDKQQLTLTNSRLQVDLTNENVILDKTCSHNDPNSKHSEPVTVPDTWHINDEVHASSLKQARDLFTSSTEQMSSDKDDKATNDDTNSVNKKGYSSFVNSKFNNKDKIQVDSDLMIEEHHKRIRSLEDMVKQLSKRLEVVEKATQHKTNQRVLIISDRGGNFRSEKFSSSMQSEMVHVRDYKSLGDDDTRRRILSKERVTDIVFDMGNLEKTRHHDYAQYIEGILTYLHGRSSAKFILMVPITDSRKCHRETTEAYKSMVTRNSMSSKVNILSTWSVYSERDSQLKGKFVNKMDRVELIRWQNLKMKLLGRETDEANMKPAEDRKLKKNL